MLANNRWVRASGDLNEKPISIQYRQDWREVADSQRLDQCVQIAWHASSVDDRTGFPALDEQEHILNFHEDLQDALEVSDNAIVAMMITHDGVNQWVIYCQQVEALQAALNGLPHEQGGYPIEVVADEDPHWQTFIQVYQAIEPPLN